MHLKHIKTQALIAEANNLADKISTAREEADVQKFLELTAELKERGVDLTSTVTCPDNL